MKQFFSILIISLLSQISYGEVITDEGHSVWKLNEKLSSRPGEFMGQTCPSEIKTVEYENRNFGVDVEFVSSSWNIGILSLPSQFRIGRNYPYALGCSPSVATPFNESVLCLASRGSFKNGVYSESWRRRGVRVPVGNWPGVRIDPDSPSFDPEKGTIENSSFIDATTFKLNLKKSFSIRSEAFYCRDGSTRCHRVTQCSYDFVR